MEFLDVHANACLGPSWPAAARRRDWARRRRPGAAACAHSRVGRSGTDGRPFTLALAHAHTTLSPRRSQRRLRRVAHDDAADQHDHDHDHDRDRLAQTRRRKPRGVNPLNLSLSTDGTGKQVANVRWWCAPPPWAHALAEGRDWKRAGGGG
jgi:hypothetical protein